MISQYNKKGWQNPWVFGLIGLVLSGVAINGVFLLNALGENRSTLVDREYNTRNRKSGAEVVKEIETQNALAWKTTIKQPKSVPLGVPTAYEVSVVDRQGLPVSGRVEVSAYRASDAAQDFTVPFKEGVSGSYQGLMRFPLKGYWKLRIRVVRGKEVFETEGVKFSVKDIDAQNALAWKLVVKPSKEAVRAAIPVVYEIAALDKQGQPVSGKMDVTAYNRASDAGQDLTIPFKEVSAGNYQGMMRFPHAGEWELSIRLIRGKDVFETDSDKFSVVDGK